MKTTNRCLTQLFLSSVSLAVLVAQSGAKDNPFDVKAEPFKSALRYSFAKTVCFASEVNWWAALGHESSFAMTRKVHERLGTTVKVDIYVRKEEAERELIYVAFPDFQVGQNTFVLLLPRLNGKFSTDNSIRIRFQANPQDMVYRQVNFTLPTDCQSVVTSEFRLQPEYVQRLRRMAHDAIEEAYHGGTGTNHVFFQPFSPQFDLDTTFYWLEGKKIIRIDLPLSPDDRPVSWKELFDFQQPMKSRQLADQATFNLRMNHEIAAHVANGLMLTIGPNRIKKVH